MLEAFKKHIKTNFHFLEDAKLLIACSGGLDSVVLANLSKDAGYNFSLAHCNYNLRGKQSDGDENFVVDLALKFGCEVHTTSFNMDDFKKNENSSIQASARQLRYEWFNALEEQWGYDFVLTAHHADDDLETHIINLSRGTGIKGLTGIPKKNGTIIRPLLPFKRSEILAFATTKKMTWREDSSNNETKYLRNKIRHNITPQLKELNANFLDNFKKTQEYLNEATTLLGVYKNELKNSLFRKDDRVVRIEIEALKSKLPLKEHLYLIFEEYGFTQWLDIENLLEAPSGKQVFSKTHKLVKDRDFLLLTELDKIDDHSYTLFEKDTEINSPISLKIKMVSEISKSCGDDLFVDAEKLKFPLLLRKWNNGDYFYPLGMKGKKKLSKFFKDEKVDILSKKNIWLLCSGNDIVWIIGKRADERFKVTPKTDKILKFELH